MLRSEGDLFTAGNDIGEFAAAATGGSELRSVARFLRAITEAGRPIVAAVQGRAVGVGATLLLHCDYVVLAEDAELVTPFVNLALVPEAASTLLMPARIGHARAFAMFALGQSGSAQDALGWGLANEVVARADLLPRAQTVAQRLAAQPLGALIATKRLMRNQQMLTAQMNAELASFAERLKTDEAREAFAAFVERRPPAFNPST